uniref:(2Fe-2S)-binding protein n=1 Tax=Burkholderia sp. Ac-20379 TaxID=2703900 RepID=UPI00197F146D
MSETVPIEFEGSKLDARRGETLAAALIAHEIRHFRTTAEGQARGVFCGMGVCQECLVEIDGVPNRRACMTKIDRPISVRRGSQRAPCMTAPPAAAMAADAPAIALRTP